MIRPILVLKPHDNNSDIVEILDDDLYPSAITHIDTFWVKGVGGDRSIYDALCDGETIKVELRRIIDPCLDPQ